MSNTLVLLIFIPMAILGAGSSVFMVASLPVILIHKIFRRIRYGEGIMD